jgi:hypothetical protein
MKTFWKRYELRFTHYLFLEAGMSLLKRNWRRLFWVLLLAVGLGCNLTSAEPTPLPTPPINTPQPPSIEPSTPLPTEAAAVQEPGEGTPTLAATVTIGAGVTAVPTVDIDTELDYRVIHVDENDILNVRSGPGSSNSIVASLSPGQTEITVVGFGQDVSGALWVPINVNSVSGWVNSRFLTENIPGNEFCADSETRALLDDLSQAIENRDGNALANISNPSRGLRVRRYWHKDGVRFENQQINNLFNLTQSYFWGAADGSGDDINGSFNDIILPLLDRNLVQSTEVGCNEILNGGTAGLIQLPFRYEGANYFSMYRPAPAGQELDWGTWVVGIERWQEHYFVSFLVHFQWEI